MYEHEDLVHESFPRPGENQTRVAEAQVINIAPQMKNIQESVGISRSLGGLPNNPNPPLPAIHPSSGLVRVPIK